MKFKTSLLTDGTLCVLIIFLVALPVLAEEASGKKTPLVNPFSEAEYLYHSGEIEKSYLLYQDYLNGKPSRDRGNIALYRLGTIHEQNRSFATALRYYKMLLHRSPNLLLTHDAKFGQAKCLFELEQYNEAEKLFKEIAYSHPDANKKWESRIHLGQLIQKRLDYKNAIEKLKTIYSQSQSNDARNQAKNLIDRIIRKSLTKIELIGLSKKYSSGFPADQILLRLISIYREERDIEKFQKVISDFLKLFPKHPKRSVIESGLKQIKSNKENKLRLGVVLPLTGQMALNGQQVLQGIQLAANESGLVHNGTLEVIIRNSVSRSVKQVVEELATDPSMIGVVGPVLSKFVKEVIPIADQYRLPLFTPTASVSGLAELSPYVFRNAMTRELEGKYIAEYAVNILRLHRFAVLYPLEGYGFELRDSFVREVESLGGEVVSVIPYERSQTDFKKQILEMGGISDDKLKKLVKDQLKNNTESVPLGQGGPMSRPLVEMGLLSEGEIQNLKVSLELSYGAIFLPGFYDKVGLIVPQLIFYNIDTTTLLGTGGWNSPELIKMTGKHIHKGYFVDGFYVQSKRPEVVQFVKKYKSTFAEEPTILSAQSYDVTKMFIKAIRSGADNRLQIKEKLARIQGFKGASGRTTILPSGEVDKKLFTMRINKKKIVEDRR